MPRKSSRKAKSSTSSNKENEETNKVWVRDLLKDFDGEVRTRTNQMKQLETSILQELKLYFTTERRKIPQHILSMKMTDYLKSGGQLDFNAVNNVDELLDNLVQETLGFKRPTTEEGLSQPPPSIVGTAKKRQKKPAPMETAIASTRQTRRTVPQTPFVAATESKLKTPAVWRAEEVLGEGRLETQQFVDAEKPYLMVPMTGKSKGNVLLMTDSSDVNDLPVGGLESPVMRSMRAMKDRLSAMIKLADVHKAKRE